MENITVLKHFSTQPWITLKSTFLQKATWLQAWYWKKAFNHNGSSTAHTKLRKVKLITFIFHAKPQMTQRNTYAFLLPWLMKSGGAFVTRFLTKPMFGSSNPVLSAISITFVQQPCPHWSSMLPSQRGQTGNAFFSLKEKDVTFCLSFFFYMGQDYFLPSIWPLHLLPPPFFPVLLGGGL